MKTNVSAFYDNSLASDFPSEASMYFSTVGGGSSTAQKTDMTDPLLRYTNVVKIGK